MSKGEPIPYEDALPIALEHMVGMGMLPYVERIAIVGSIRRKSEFVKDIDYQVITTNTAQLKRYWFDRDFYIESAGDRRIILEDEHGTRINLFISKSSYWGSMMMHNTGPKRYNIRKRALVKKQNMHLTQYGLWREQEDNPDDIDKPIILVASKTEEDIYDALGWEYCEPENRI
jgi:DNA polymerase (family 10)